MPIGLGGIQNGAIAFILMMIAIIASCHMGPTWASDQALVNQINDEIYREIGGPYPIGVACYEMAGWA